MHNQVCVCWTILTLWAGRQVICYSALSRWMTAFVFSQTCVCFIHNYDTCGLCSWNKGTVGPGLMALGFAWEISHLKCTAQPMCHPEAHSLTGGSLLGLVLDEDSDQHEQKKLRAWASIIGFKALTLDMLAWEGAIIQPGRSKLWREQLRTHWGRWDYARRGRLLWASTEATRSRWKLEP